MDQPRAAWAGGDGVLIVGDGHTAGGGQRGALSHEIPRVRKRSRSQQRVAPEAAGHGADVSVCLEMALAVLLRLALSCGDELACRSAGAVFATWLRNGAMRLAYCALRGPCLRLAAGLTAPGSRIPCSIAHRWFVAAASSVPSAPSSRNHVEY